MTDGILNVYKEAGWTSSDVVCKLRSVLHQKKIGHTGTLDPDATGVLPVCLGNGTKVCDLITDHEKEYKAVLRLGITTDTEDLSGKILRESAVNCSEQAAANAVMSMVGTYDQLPPMYSARKINGKKLYEYARAGIEVERKPKTITVSAIEILRMDLPEIEFTVHCSRGTYIRSICHDIGEKLGCGGSMVSLIRTKVGGFRIEDAHTIEEIQSAFAAGMLDAWVYAPDSQFTGYPAMVPAGDKDLSLIRNGNAVSLRSLRYADHAEQTSPGHTAPGKIRVYDREGKFLAVYAFDNLKNKYKPVKMFL